MPSSSVALVTLLALGVYLITFAMTGRARRRFVVRAPAVTGPPEFERAFRVQQNTVEQLIVFLPALWLFAMFVSPRWGAGLGLVWVAARLYYAVCYYRNPETRGPGFAVALVAAMLLWLGALVGTLSAML